MERSCPLNPKRVAPAPKNQPPATAPSDGPSTSSGPPAHGRRPFTFGDIPVAVKKFVKKGKKNRKLRESGDSDGAGTGDQLQVPPQVSPSATSVISGAYERVSSQPPATQKVVIDAMLIGDSNEEALTDKIAI